MLGYIEYLNLPTKLAIGLVLAFFIMQGIGEFLEFKGKVVPEFVKVRKYFARKKKEREALGKVSDLLDEYRQMADTIQKTNELLADFDQHYSKDNIAKRDKWIEEVNDHITSSDKKRAEQDKLMRELSNKLDKNNADTLSILIENKRNTIIDFSGRVADQSYPATREQFNRIFKMHKDYERIIEENDLTNGEVNIAMQIIQESYENHLRNHSFVEDIRGYGL